MKTIVIDPGHGGASSGAIHDGQFEKELNLIFAQALERTLHYHFVRPGYEPIRLGMTRYTDRDVQLWQRGTESAKLGADLVLSIHHNANDVRSARGTEFYVDSGDTEAIACATKMADAWPSLLSVRRNPIIRIDPNPPRDDWKRRPWNVIAPHRDHASVVLIEVGYMTNGDDMALLSSSVIRRHIFAAVICGVAEWLFANGEGHMSGY